MRTPPTPVSISIAITYRKQGDSSLPSVGEETFGFNLFVCYGRKA